MTLQNDISIRDSIFASYSSAVQKKFLNRKAEMYIDSRVLALILDMNNAEKGIVTFTNQAERVTNQSNAYVAAVSQEFDSDGKATWVPVYKEV
jgi:hypothetical protein